MSEETPTSKPSGHTSPALWLARWVAGLSATAWGCLAIFTAYPVFTNAVTLFGALSGNLDLVIWSLLKTLVWGALWLAMVWAFRFRYRREHRARLAEAAQATVVIGNADAAPQLIGARTFTHILLHFSWAVLFSIGSLTYLSGAPSSADVNVWGVRVLTLLTLGLVGSLLIHLSWWGRQHWVSAKFWFSWWGVTLVGILLGVSVAMQLVPL